MSSVLFRSLLQAELMQMSSVFSSVDGPLPRGTCAFVLERQEDPFALQEAAAPIQRSPAGIIAAGEGGGEETVLNVVHIPVRRGLSGTAAKKDRRAAPRALRSFAQRSVPSEKSFQTP